MAKIILVFAAALMFCICCGIAYAVLCVNDRKEEVGGTIRKNEPVDYQMAKAG